MAQLTDYTDLVTSEHSDKPRFMATLSAVAQCFVDLQNGLIDIPDEFDLDNAVGVQLDAVGLWVGISRKVNTPLAGVYFSFDTAGLGFDQGVWQGPFDPTTGVTSLDDDTYRLLLRAKIGANHWDGTLGTSAAILNAIFGGSASSSTPVTITATNEPFGTGDGNTKQFQLTYQGVPLFSVVDAQLYRNDWQGNQLLYATPRTNILVNSSPDSNASGNVWRLGANAQRIGTVIGPDGANTALEYASIVPGNCYIGYGATLTVGQTYTFSVWVRKISNAPLTTGVLLNINNQFNAGPLSANAVTTTWNRFSVTFTATQSSTTCYPITDWDSGAHLQVGDAQLETGGTVTSFIPTTTAAVTVTDYTLTPTGLVTLASAPLVAAALTWSGHGTQYPTGTYVFIVDNGDMTIDYGIAGTLPSAVFLALLRGGYIPLKPEAVHINGYYTPSVSNTPLFGFDVANNLIAGFDVGSWAVLA